MLTNTVRGVGEVVFFFSLNPQLLAKKLLNPQTFISACRELCGLIDVQPAACIPAPPPPRPTQGDSLSDIPPFGPLASSSAACDLNELRLCGTLLEDCRHSRGLALPFCLVHHSGPRWEILKQIITGFRKLPLGSRQDKRQI